MRRTSLLTAVFSLVLAVLGPAAWAAGEGSVPAGVSQDPFTGAPPATNGGAERGGGFTFFGSGFGHGLGMSQWGSYGLALEGWDHARILKNFYRGTRVVKDQHPVAKLRVGITYDRTLIHLGARSGPVRLWIGKPKGNFVAKIPGGKTWTVRSTGQGLRDPRPHRRPGGRQGLGR